MLASFQSKELFGNCGDFGLAPGRQHVVHLGIVNVLSGVAMCKVPTTMDAPDANSRDPRGIQSGGTPPACVGY
jgi:hypothetical protein